MRLTISAIAVTALLIVALAGCATGADTAGTPETSGTAPATPEVSGVPLEPALAARLQRDAGAGLRLDRVLVAGVAGDETFAVVDREANEQERAGHGRAAAMWIATGDGAFRNAADYISYNFACRDDDPVCPEVRPGGLGFAALRHQPGGRIFVLVGATRDGSVQVTTAEGKVYQVGAAPRGTVVEIATAEPHRTRIRVARPDGRHYELMLPPFGVVTG